MIEGTSWALSQDECLRTFRPGQCPETRPVRAPFSAGPHVLALTETGHTAATGRPGPATLPLVFCGTFPEMFPSRNTKGRRSFRQLFNKHQLQSHQKVPGPESGPFQLRFTVAMEGPNAQRCLWKQWPRCHLFYQGLLVRSTPRVWPGSGTGLWALGPELSQPGPPAWFLQPSAGGGKT